MKRIFLTGILMLLCTAVAVADVEVQVTATQTGPTDSTTGQITKVSVNKDATFSVKGSYNEEPKLNAEEKVTGTSWEYTINAPDGVTCNKSSGEGKDIVFTASGNNAGTYQIEIEMKLVFTITKYKADMTTVISTRQSDEYTGSDTATINVWGNFTIVVDDFLPKLVRRSVTVTSDSKFTTGNFKLNVSDKLTLYENASGGSGSQSIEWSSAILTKTIYVEGTSASTTIGDQTLTASYSGSNMETETKNITVVYVLLEPYTPATKHIAPRLIPFANARTNKVGIRSNGDYDNGGSVRDRTMSVVIPNEDDLIRTDVIIMPSFSSSITNSELEYVIKRDSSKIFFWTSPQKGTMPYNIPVSGQSIASGGSLWAEWSSNPHGTCTFSIEAIEKKSGKTIMKDEIIYRTFTSVTCAFVGEFQTAGNATASPGINDWVIGELSNGYDVHVWDDGHDWFSGDEADEWGRGPAYDELVNAANNRGIDKIALVGYSHGGGTVHNVAWRIDKNYNNTKGHNFLVPLPQQVFTSYVDAVSNSTFLNPFEENRRPPGSIFHYNQYQQNKLPHGGLSSADIEVNHTSIGLTHDTIDDNGIVQGNLKTQFETKTSR
jgi:hypothetical protein